VVCHWSLSSELSASASKLQRPRNWGARFSRKAVVPSFLSSVAAQLCEYPGLSFQRSPVCACSLVSSLLLSGATMSQQILSYAISSFCPTSVDGLQRAAVFGRERPGEFLSEVRGRTQHGNRIEKNQFM